MSEHNEIGCLLMAAGNASRFGENKLAAQLDGKTLIYHAMQAIPRALFSQVVVVTQYPEIAELARQFDFTPVENKHPDYGISYTIKLGTEVLKHCDAILYLVSDQPMLDDTSVERIVALWKRYPCNIVGAGHDGIRGNPNIFPREFFDELMQLREDSGGNTVIRAHPDRLLLVEVAKEELTDVDTPKALEELKKEIGQLPESE